MRKREAERLETPIASLIDVVFLLIIFFVTTAAIERDIVDETIRLAQARHVKAAERKDPSTITINIRKDGTINIATQPLSLSELQQILTAAVHDYGNRVPILLRVDKDTLYHEVDRVMEVIGRTGLYRVRIAAVAGE